MRTHYIAASLTLAAALTACNHQDAPTTAQATAALPTLASDLATAPLPYQRMRFVSALEQTPRSALAPARVASRQTSRVVATHHDVSIATAPALASLKMSADVGMAVASSVTSVRAVSATAMQAAPPMSMPAEVAAEFAADRGRIDGGLVGRVLIRGGVGPNGKCDPRSDAQAAGMLAGRPNSAMPLMPSMSVFGRR
jgi:hypothetical protein